MLQVHLYKNHFTFANVDVTFPYNGFLQSFIEALDTLVMNSMVMQSIPSKYFENGTLKVDCVDHRVEPNVQKQLLLKGMLD